MVKKVPPIWAKQIYVPCMTIKASSSLFANEFTIVRAVEN